MSDFLWGVCLFSSGMGGLLFPWLMEHVKGRMKLSASAEGVYMSVQRRFERRVSLSLMLAVVGFLWILGESR